MLDTTLLRLLHRTLPGFVPGARLHRAALEAASAGRWSDSRACLGAAAEAYRREMAVEPLARLRVHELMLAVRRPGSETREADAMQEIVRRVNRLSTLESLEAPFEAADARVVLAQWVGEAPATTTLRSAA